MIWLSLAFAGNGPWVIPPSATNLYVGGYHERFDHVSTSGGVVDLDDGVATNGFAGIASLGLVEGYELEVGATLMRSRHLDAGSPTCTRPGRTPDFCDLSQGLGPAHLAVKGVLLDERALRPVSVALSVRGRSTDWVSESRGRLTALGEGQTDFGLGLSVGRTGAVGERGWYRTSLDAGYWYRLPLARNPKVPGDEVSGSLAAMISPRGVLGFGPNLDFFQRLTGDDLGAEVDLSSPNGFASLQVAQLKAGGTVSVSGEQGVTVSVSAYGTAYAQNNPTDSFLVSAGVGWYRPRGGHDSEP